MREPMAPGDPQVGGTPAEISNHPDTNQNTMAPTNRTTQSQATTQINQLNIIDNNNHDTTSNQPTDTYYTPWGDTIQLEKRPQTVQLALQNFGGWPQWNNHHKNQAIRQFLNEKNRHLHNHREQRGMAPHPGATTTTRENSRVVGGTPSLTWLQ